MSDFAASSEVSAEIGRWLGYLGAERRMSQNTVECYRRDVAQFLGFLAEHLSGAPTLKQIAKLTPADIRAFMAFRRSQGTGNRSLMRALAGIRSFARFLERKGKGKVAALGAVRTAEASEELAETAFDACRLADYRCRFARRRGPCAVDFRT